jgi:hypothetical protein
MLRDLFVILTMLVAAAAMASAGEPVWKYVAADDFRPVPRSVRLTTTKPDDLREDVVFRGKKRKYAQIRYGSEDSRRVTVVVDEVSPDDWDLFVDADRNWVIEAKDKVPGKGRERSARLDVEITRGFEIVHEPRTVQWRLGALGNSISLATVGYVEGHVQIDGKRVAVRRVDGDANGFFADPADRLWLDLNGDGKWDPITEQFPVLPVLTLGKQRYAVRGDAIGKKLALEPVTAEGTIRLQLNQLKKDVTVVKCHAMLVCKDGAAIGITSIDDPIVVPAGKYALGAVSLSVKHSAATRPVHFVFSRIGVDDTVRWYELKKDQELVLDPIGKLRFDLDIDQNSLTPKAGAAVDVQPRLVTADGLLINSCAHGDEVAVPYGGGPVSSLKLYDAKKKLLDTKASGFS